MSYGDENPITPKRVFLFGLGAFGTTVLLIGLLALCALGSAFATIWWNTHIQTQVESSKRVVQTCQLQYFDSQKTAINDNLTAINNLDREIVDPAYKDQVAILQAQQLGDARSVYLILDKAHCNRSDIVADMPELQAFFERWDGPTGHSSATVTP